MNIAIVISEFNEEITSRMNKVCKEKAKDLGLKISYECKVPGSYDMPIIVDALLRKKKVDGVITLGAIITGQTKHDEVISHATAQSLNRLSIKHRKPVSFGIIGPALKEKHARVRIRPVSERATEAVFKIFVELEKLK